MPCASAEKWYFDTYAPRLSFDAMHQWSIRQQIEAFDELDVIAEMTTDNVMRGACLGVLTGRPDIAVLSKLGCKEDGEEFLALFENEYAVGSAPDVALSVLNACRTAEKARMQERKMMSDREWPALYETCVSDDINVLWFSGHGSNSDGPLLA